MEDATDATIQEAVNLTTKLAPANDGLGSNILPKDHTEIQNQVNLIKKPSVDREMSLNHEFLLKINIPGISKNLNVIPEKKITWLLAFRGYENG